MEPAAQTSCPARRRDNRLGDGMPSREGLMNLCSEEAEVGVTSRDVEEDPFTDLTRQSTAAAARTLFPAATARNDEKLGVTRGYGGSDSEPEDEDDSHYATRQVIKRLTHAYRVAVERQQLSMFLTKDGTLISIFTKDGSEVTPSIVARLRSRDTLLRTSEDSSMLLQALLDVVVDKQLEITEAFRRKLDMVGLP